MLEGRDIVVFGEDFARHPHCLEHVVRRLLPRNRVLWVETVGMREPRLTLYDLRRAMEKARAWTVPGGAPAGEALPPNLTRLSLPLLPFNRFRWVRKLNRRLGVEKVRRAMDALHFRSPIVLTSIPTTCDLVGELGESLSIYYCVDEFALWPGIDSRVVGPMEDELLGKVDLVLATSRALVEKKARKHPRTELLTHGVDRHHFQPRAGKRRPPRRKTIGFFGLIDERVDLELVRGLSERFPDAEIRFLGETVVDVSVLSGRSNVFWDGKVPYADLPRAIESFSALVLPYRLNELTRHINPLKIKEYLATEKPIVTTALPELEPFRDAIHVARDAEDFFQGVRNALTKPGLVPAERMRAHLTGESWDDKAEWLSRRIEELAPA